MWHRDAMPHDTLDSDASLTQNIPVARVIAPRPLRERWTILGLDLTWFNIHLVTIYKAWDRMVTITTKICLKNLDQHYSSSCFVIYSSMFNEYY